MIVPYRVLGSPAHHIIQLSPPKHMIETRKIEQPRHQPPASVAPGMLYVCQYAAATKKVQRISSAKEGHHCSVTLTRLRGGGVSTCTHTHTHTHTYIYICCMVVVDSAHTHVKWIHYSPRCFSFFLYL